MGFDDEEEVEEEEEATGGAMTAQGKTPMIISFSLLSLLPIESPTE